MSATPTPEADTPEADTPEAAKHCLLCPRLVTYRQDNQRAQPDWFNGAVPSFGTDKAELLIVGLAPGLKGANRTGRPFTGDAAGELLYRALSHFGFTHGVYDRRADDGLTLKNVMITNAVRCVPPQNKPTAMEIHQCRPFLAARIQSLPRLKIILALGKIAHDSVITALGHRIAQHHFAHAARHKIGDVTLYDSYHCSRYNVNTKRLTEEMFFKVFATIRAELEQ